MIFISGGHVIHVIHVMCVTNVNHVRHELHGHYGVGIGFKGNAECEINDENLLNDVSKNGMMMMMNYGYGY